MNPTQNTLFNFGVHDTRDISLTSLFSEILDAQGWLHKDCYHWINKEGLLHVINTSNKNLGMLVFKVESPVKFTCLVSSMVHKSLLF